jgi:DNA polymerase-3 subunit gamma/tau
MAHQSLYRRYRPQRFSEVRGQATVVGALRSAVAEERVGHAYLFSGPRGTGKTSTARILAKALNCEDLQDGEPCTVCASCVAMQAGTSYDLQELDAASNNKVEDVRSLIERVALGSPGRTKVYILDEVHMLSPGASNALLKTLEEPPDHVVFVLATTDPQKVLPTIRSRTQHFEFHLLPADELAEHVRWVISDAGLSVDDSAVEHVLRAGGGSARDTLSYLDQAAAGGVSADGDHAEVLAEAVVAVDTAAALTAVAAATTAGRDPRILGEALLAHLRDVFLLRMGGPLGHLSDAARERVEGWAGRVTDRTVTRALEEVGEALLAMRQAPDPRIPLEVALVRITRSTPAAAGGEGTTGVDELVERIERLEAGLAGLAAGAPVAAVVPSAPVSEPAPAAPVPVERPPAGPPPADPPPARDETPAAPAEDRSAAPPTGRAAARAAAQQASGTRPAPPRAGGSDPAPPPPPPGRARAETSPPAPAAEPVPPAETAPPEPPPEAAAPPQDEAPAPAAPAGDTDLRALWAERVVPGLKGALAALLRGIDDTSAEGDVLTVRLPNQPTLARTQQSHADVEAALSSAAGRSVRLVLALADGDGPRRDDGAASAGPSRRPEPADDPVEVIDPAELVDAPAQQLTGVDRVTEAFPGAQIVDP